MVTPPEWCEAEARGHRVLPLDVVLAEALTALRKHHMVQASEHDVSPAGAVMRAWRRGRIDSALPAVQCLLILWVMRPTAGPTAGVT